MESYGPLVLGTSDCHCSCYICSRQVWSCNFFKMGRDCMGCDLSGIYIDDYILKLSIFITLLQL